MLDERANKMSAQSQIDGLRSRVKIMARPYKKDNALCSPTSALEKKQILNRLGVELRNPSCGPGAGTAK
jgi:hypothetical protein